MKWSNIKVIFRRELRDQLRDRRTLFMVFVLPVILYPALSILMVSLISQGKARLESLDYKVGIVGVENAPGLLDLDDKKHFPVRLFVPDKPRKQATGAGPAPEDVQRRQRLHVMTDGATLDMLETGEIHVLVTFGKDFKLDEQKSAPVTIHYDSADEKSRTAAKAVREVLRRWNGELRLARLGGLGKPIDFINPIRLEDLDIATPAEAGAARLSSMFAFLLVIMALTGAFYPAVDLCAGEKERGTMETLLISPATRSEIVMGKYLTVMLASVATAVLNLAGMGVTAWHLMNVAARSTAGTPIEFSINPLSIAWMLVLLVPLAALFSASCLAMSTFARSTKEGQYYLTPLFIIVFPLVLITMTPGLELNPLLACVPVTGTALLLKELMQGHYQTGYLYALPVLASTTFYAYLALHWTVGLFRRESVLFREAEKLDMKLWAKSLLVDKGATPSPGAAFAAALLIAGLMFFMAPRLSETNLPTMSLMMQLAFVLTPVLVMTGFLTSSYRRTLLLRWPGVTWMAAAVVLAITVQPLIVEFFHWLMQYVTVPEELKKIERALHEARDKMPLLLLTGLALAPGVCEELTFRGFVLNGVLRSHRVGGAIFISALLFAAVHLNPIQFPNALVLGLLLGLLAVRSGSILPGILFHAIHNGISVMGGHDTVLMQEGSWMVRTVGADRLFSLPVLALSAVCVAAMVFILWRQQSRIVVDRGEA